MGFDHDGFARSRAARRRVSPCRRPSAPFGWESLHRNAACSDALLSRGAARVELPPSPVRVAFHQGGSLLAPHQASPWHAPVGRVPRRRQSAFDWLEPAFQQGGRDTARNRARAIDRVPSSRRAAHPPGQGLGQAPHRYRAVCPPRESRGKPARRDTSSPSLCSRLVFKCTRHDTLFPGRSFRFV